MRMLTGKALVLSSLNFIYLVNFIIKAQPAYPFHYCNNATTYTLDSKFGRNLDTALTNLQASNSGYGYFNSSAGQGNDTANVICLCRGDVELNMCQSCLKDSIYRLRHSCPNETEAVVYYEFCLLKYSNAPILGSNDMNKDAVYLDNESTFDDKKQFNGFLQPFMNKLRGEAAAGNSLLKFAMENTTGPDSKTLYGLTQCIPTLSKSQCDDCLEYAINQLSLLCDGRIGAIAFMGARCNVRYEIYEFYINPAILPSPSLPISVLQPSPPPVVVVTLILKLVTTKYDGRSGIREHIMMMNDMANKPKGLDMEISDGFLVHFIITSLPSSYEALKINYNTQKDKWKMGELVAMGVQEEERMKMDRTTDVASNSKKRKNNYQRKDTSKVQRPNPNTSVPSSSKNSLGKIHCNFCKKT
ncbi:putative Gnk2-like domain-containing protein [Helianthus annuus]|nr:putative Gnk2-like domain-containing protein [Helianthus annuus]